MVEKYFNQEKWDLILLIWNKADNEIRLQHCILPFIYENKFPGHKCKIFLNRKNINPAENDTSVVPQSLGNVNTSLLVKKQWDLVKCSEDN